MTKIQLSLIAVATVLFTACSRMPPDYRAMVTLPVYTEGDADKGAVIYEEACGQCHQLTAGLNQKGPQLMNIYGAPAASLKDYEYGAALSQSGWVWDAKTLDPYIADAEKAMPNSKMLADPMPDAQERADVIAYLSTLRAEVPKLDADGFPVADATATTTKTQNIPAADEPVEIVSGDENKPAASF